MASSFIFVASFIVILNVQVSILEGKQKKCVHENRVCVPQYNEQEFYNTENGPTKCCKGLKCSSKKCIYISDSSSDSYDNLPEGSSDSYEEDNARAMSDYSNKYLYYDENTHQSLTTLNISILQCALILLIISICLCGCITITILFFVMKQICTKPQTNS
eukprot:UN09087